MAQRHTEKVYRFKVEACPREYGPDAKHAGQFIVVIAAHAIVQDLFDLLDSRQHFDPCEVLLRDGEGRCSGEYNRIDEIGFGSGEIFRVWGGCNLQLTSLEAVAADAELIECTKGVGVIVHDRFDTDWLEELQTRWDRQDRLDLSGDDPGLDDAEADIGTDFRIEWDGYLTELGNEQTYWLKHQSREDDVPALDMLQGIVSVGGTDQRMPIDVGLLHLLGPNSEIVRTLDCRERMSWGSETFASLGVPAIPVDDGTGDSFDAYVAEFEARGQCDAGFNGKVRIRVYSNAEFWKRKLRGQRVG